MTGHKKEFKFMSFALHSMGRRFMPVSLLLFCTTLLCAKPDYRHVTVGNIDVVTSMSEERTTRFLHELLAIRETVSDVLGSPVLEPATQIIIFSSQPEMDEFYPQITHLSYGYSQWLNTKWHCSTSPYGDTFSIINEWPNDKRYRQAALRSYASWLISRVVPECPTWISDGLAEFVCTLEYRDGMVRLGESIIEEKGASYPKRVPLATLLQGRVSPRTRDVCGIWRLWLTSDYEGNRMKTRRLIELMRQGAPGNGETVSRAFGMPLDDIQSALNKHLRKITESTVERPSPVASLLGNLVYQPATDFELEVAKGMILTTLKNRPTSLEADLVSLEETHPSSPRPAEVLARLALIAADQDAAERHWLRALEKGTVNTTAHLHALRRRLEPRSTRIDLQPALSPQLAHELRAASDRCLKLNPGEFEAYHWLAWTEALAPDPQEERLQAVEDSPARFLRPGVYIPMAVAHLRLKRFEHAITLMEEYLRIFGARSRNQTAAEFLLDKARSGLATETATTRKI